MDREPVEYRAVRCLLLLRKNHPVDHLKPRRNDSRGWIQWLRQETTAFNLAPRFRSSVGQNQPIEPLPNTVQNHQAHYIGSTYIAQHYIIFLCVSHQFLLVIGPVRSSTNSTLWGAYSPAAIMALVTIHTHKQSLSNQVPIHSWVEKVHIHMKCLPQGHSAKPRQPRHVPKTFRSKVAGHSHRALTTRMYMKYIVFMYRDTGWSLPGSLSSSVVPLRPTQCQWDGATIYVVVRATRDTQSPRRGLNPGPPRDMTCSLLVIKNFVTIVCYLKKHVLMRSSARYLPLGLTKSDVIHYKTWQNDMNKSKIGRTGVDYHKTAVYTCRY